jgi:multicomponent K+:H+ antiporter subunit C
MEMLVALAVGILTMVGVYLILRQRTFPVILGLSFLSYAVNLFLFAAGRVATGAIPIIGASAAPTDPLPQALVLTAIVISFGMTAVIVLMAVAAWLDSGDDRIELADDKTDHARDHGRDR